MSADRERMLLQHLREAGSPDPYCHPPVLSVVIGGPEGGTVDIDGRISFPRIVAMAAVLKRYYPELEGGPA